jgi:hypothetical protein
VKIFRTKLTIVGHELKQLQIPEAIAKSLDCQYVDILFDGQSLVVVPVPLREV